MKSGSQQRRLTTKSSENGSDQATIDRHEVLQTLLLSTIGPSEGINKQKQAILADRRGIVFKENARPDHFIVRTWH